MTDVLRKSLNWVYWGGIAQSATDTFATGTLITAYALLLGAGDFAIGLLGAVPFIGNLMHIFAAFLLEKGFSVKKLSIVTSAVSRPFFLVAAVLAFFPRSDWVVPTLICCLLMVYSIGNIAGGAWRPWMKNLVPNRLMGSFFSSRFKGMMIAKIVCFAFCWLILEYYRRYFPAQELHAYFYLLLLSFLISVFGVYTTTQVADVKVSTPSKMSFVQKIKMCMKKKEFVHLMTVLGCLNFVVNFVTPFLTVFLLQKLNLSMPTVVFLTLFPQVVYVIAIKKIGALSDSKGLPRMMTILLPSYPVVLACFVFLFTVKMPVVLFWTLLIAAHICLGVGQAAVALGSNNLSLLFIPKCSAVVYLAVNSSVIAFCGALGSVAGGSFMTIAAKISQMFSVPNGNWYGLFFLTFILFLPITNAFKNLKRID